MEVGRGSICGGYAMVTHICLVWFKFYIIDLMRVGKLWCSYMEDECGFAPYMAGWSSWVVLVGVWGTVDYGFSI